jgi:4-methyl-5(b-hydroxyethyl)-thiazole monophosphate biosynthesis
MSGETVKTLLFLAHGFEDLEAIAVLDVFGWTQYRGHLPEVSVTTAGFHRVVKSRFGLEIRPACLFSEIDAKTYHALCLPGGFHGHGYDEAYDPRIYRTGAENGTPPSDVLVRGF